MEQPGAPCPPGFFGAGPGLPAEQGGRGREQEKSVAKTGGNEQQRTLATSANFSGFLRGPAQGTRSREAKQWRIVLRTGQVTPGVCTCFLSSRRPLQRWVGGAASTVGSQGQRSVQTGLSGAGGQAPARCARCSSPGSVRRRQRVWPCCHSTRKRTSTTSRTAKRMAMAHHWRRSARQDTRISSLKYDPRDTAT